MFRAWVTAMCLAVGLVAVAGGGTAGATAACRTTTLVQGRAHRPVTLKRCDKLKVVFKIGTQGTTPAFWGVARRPSPHVLKLTHHGYQNPTHSSDTTEQVWVYRAVGRGTTHIRFTLTAPSAPGQTFGAYKVSVTVR